MIQNAIDHNTFEGTVFINAHYDTEKQQLIFIVTDQGVGMQIEEQKTLF